LSTVAGAAVTIMMRFMSVPLVVPALYLQFSLVGGR